MTEQILCIVDMQDYFNSTAKHCLPGVLTEIAHAKAHNQPIVVLEYWNRDEYDSTGNGIKLSDTNKPIIDALKWYRRKSFVKKFDDGGGDSLAKIAKQKGYSIDNVRLVGVNRNYCILRTAEELMSITASKNNGRTGIIEVVRGASWCHNPKGGLRSLRHIGAKIVNQHRCP